MAGAVDPYDLDRFRRAHEGDYERALSEIAGGRKRSHWMWYIFPQLDGLGFSSTASVTRSRASTRPGPTSMTRSWGRGCWSARRPSSASKADPRVRSSVPPTT